MESSGLTSEIVFYSISFLGIAFLAFCMFLLFLSRSVRKLQIYLVENHERFYSDFLDTPFLAGGCDVLGKHFKAFKVTYFGQMPDEESGAIQKRAKLLIKLSLFSFISIPVSMLAMLVSAYCLNGGQEGLYSQGGHTLILVILSHIFRIFRKGDDR